MNVIEYLEAKNVPYEVLTHPHAVGARELAHTLDVPCERIAKTVLLRADRGFAYILAVLPGDRRVDLEKVSRALAGARLELASEEEIDLHCPDCAPGVLPPFGSAYDMETLVDASLICDGNIVFPGNNRMEAIRMKYDDYAAIEHPLVAHFAVDDHIAHAN